MVKKTELEGGLILEDLKIGEGYEVKAGGAVVALYHGTLKSNGEVFDSAFEGGVPIAFPLNGVIEGWTKGVPGMKVGGIRRLTIPGADGLWRSQPQPQDPSEFRPRLRHPAVSSTPSSSRTSRSARAKQRPALTSRSHVIKNDKGEELEKHEISSPYIWIPGELDGVQFGLEGMKVGGKRKLIIPKEMNKSQQGFMTTRTQNVPVTMEVELIAVNLPHGAAGDLKLTSASRKPRDSVPGLFMCWGSVASNPASSCSFATSSLAREHVMQVIRATSTAVLFASASVALASPPRWEAVPGGPDGPIASDPTTASSTSAAASAAPAARPFPRNLAAWNGSVWSPGPGVDQRVEAFARFGPPGQEELIAGGMFGVTGDSNGLARLA